MRISRVIAVLLLLATGVAFTGCTSAQGSTPAEKRAFVDSMAASTLEEFYKQDPTLKSRVENAPGYGVFSKIGTNLIFISTEGGHGKVHNNITGKDTYMKVIGGGIGIGLGIKDYKLLMIYRTEYVIGDFIANGWSANAEADAAAKAGNRGGQASTRSNLEDDIEVHTLTENGLALSATISATKFTRDSKLNGFSQSRME